MAHHPRVSGYKVKKDDTLWGIAKAQYDDPLHWKEIAKANGISDPRKLLAGMTLKLPIIMPPINQGGQSIGVVAIPASRTVSSDVTTILPPKEANYAAKPVLFPSFRLTPTDAFKNLDVGARGSKCRMKLNFDLLAKRSGTIDLVEVNSRGLDFTPYQSETRKKFSQVLSEAKIQFDAAKGGFTVSLGTSAAITDAKGNVLLASKIEGIPGMTIKYICEAKEIKASSGDIEFSGKFGFEVECRNDDDPQKKSSQAALPVAVPGQWNTPKPLIVAGEVLLVGAAATIVVISLPADVIVAGAMSFVEAASLFGRIVPITP